MHPRLSASFSAPRVHELRTAAEARGLIRRAVAARRRRARAEGTADLGPAVTIRPAGPGDCGALVALAALDSQSAPRGPVLVAEVEGELWAALGIEGGHQIADPFRATSDLRALLRARARHLSAAAPAAAANAGARSAAPRPRAA